MRAVKAGVLVLGAIALGSAAMVSGALLAAAGSPGLGWGLYVAGGVAAVVLVEQAARVW